ncbi:MAG: DUF3592 domain-containing protein [Saprospiraceae bacterium]|nr:DUF3592 domain-containing protein [Saprospiraceae bacterium]
MRSQGCIYFFFGIFAAAGLLCGAISLGQVYSRYQVTSTGIHARGTVVDLLYSKNSVAPVVSYTDENGTKRLYESSSFTSINPPEIGDQLDLYYLPEKPNEVELEGEGWFNLFPLIFFFTHGGVGFGGIYWLEKKRRMYNWLQQHGQEVEAKLVEILHGASKGRSYYTLRCEWKDPYTQEIYVFESETFSQDLSGRISVGSIVRVLIDPDKPKRYMVITSFLDT